LGYLSRQPERLLDPRHAKTDTASSNVETGVLFPYNRSFAIIHCPSDRSTIAGTAQLRFRSYSMCDWINGNDFWVTFPVSKLSQLINPGPALTFVFIDENEESDNGSFGMAALGTWRWIDWPSARHSRGGTLSFADGHVEWWQWRDPGAVTFFPDYRHLVTPPDRDLVRLQEALPRP
jgi:prepilin-type processing-associated H-X9-DG protein